jgi:DNA-binding response OmpR family regulator
MKTPLPATVRKTVRVRVLIAEDESRLGALLAESIAEIGWEPTVRTDGGAALAAARTGDYDVLLLDWMLPVLDGPAVIAALRAEGHRIPILLLTARGDVRDRVEGLNAGADDYLAKPFDLDELLARLRALHRRGNPGLAVAQRAGDLFVDPVARRVERAGTTIEVSAREFDILLLLVQRAGQVVSRYAILDEVWDGDTDLRSNVIDVHVATLRAKIDKPFGRAAIETVRGAGYRLDPAGG